MSCFWRDVVNAVTDCGSVIYCHFPKSGETAIAWAGNGASYESVIISQWTEYDAIGSKINQHLTWFNINNGEVIEDKIITDNQASTIYFTNDCVISSTVLAGTPVDADMYIYDVNTRSRLTPVLPEIYRKGISLNSTIRPVGFNYSPANLVICDITDPFNPDYYEYTPSTGELINSHTFATPNGNNNAATLSSGKITLDIRPASTIFTHVADIAAGTLSKVTGTLERSAFNTGSTASNGDTFFSHKVQDGFTVLPYEIIDIATNTVLSTGTFSDNFNIQQMTSRGVKAIDEGFVYYADDAGDTGYGTFTVTDKHFNTIRSMDLQHLSRYPYWGADVKLWNFSSPMIVGATPLDGMAYELGDVLIGISIR